MKRPEPDWNQPIVWHDGTPAEVVPNSERWGSIGVDVSADRMPTGVRFNGYPGKDDEGRTYISVLKFNGDVQDPGASLHGYVENVSESERREATDSFAMF